MNTSLSKASISNNQTDLKKPGIIPIKQIYVIITVAQDINEEPKVMVTTQSAHSKEEAVGIGYLRITEDNTQRGFDNMVIEAICLAPDVAESILTENLVKEYKNF